MSLPISKKEAVALMNESYAQRQLHDVGDYVIDKSLSGQRVQVYWNAHLGKAIIVHRGTQGARDWYGNVQSFFGNHAQTRFTHARRITQEAVAKYGADNIISLGHSKGALVNRVVSDPNQIMIHVNGAHTLQESILPQTKRPNEYTIRNARDVVSALDHRVPNGKELVMEKEDGSAWDVPTNHYPDSVLDQNGEGLHPWRDHVQKYRRTHQCTYKEAMTRARETYK